MTEGELINAMLHRRFPADAAVTFAAIVRLAGQPITTGALADLTHVSRATASRNLGKLVAAKFLVKTRGKNCVTLTPQLPPDPVDSISKALAAVSPPTPQPEAPRNNGSHSNADTAAKVREILDVFRFRPDIVAGLPVPFLTKLVSDRYPTNDVVKYAETFRDDYVPYVEADFKARAPRSWQRPGSTWAKRFETHIKSQLDPHPFRVRRTATAKPKKHAT